MVAANMQGEWLSGYFLGVVTAPIYFASTQNMWTERLWPYFTEWNVLTDRVAATGFYEGLPPGAPFPWDAWIALFPGWVLFLGAVFLANFCVVILLRKQWMEHERLSFPIATALLELTGTGDSKDAFCYPRSLALFSDWICTHFWRFLLECRLMVCHGIAPFGCYEADQYPHWSRFSTAVVSLFSR